MFKFPAQIPWAAWLNSSLFKNSFFILASTGIASLSGFLFWTISARLYSSDQVGLAGTIVSASALIMSISSLGINNSFIRYLSGSKQAQNMVNSGTIFVFASSIATISVYLFLLPFLLHKQSFLTADLLIAGLFILLCLGTNLNNLVDSVFIALRSTKYNLATYTLIGLLKVILIFLLAGWGANGLVLALTLSIIAGLTLGYFFIHHYLHFHFKWQFDWSVIKSMFKFSIFTYLTALAGGLPSFILPLIILQKLGASAVAYFYMPMMMATLIFAIPNSVASSLFSEGSHDTSSLRSNLNRSLLAILPTLLSVVVLTIFFGKYILLIFGREYAESGYLVLVWLSLSSIFMAVSSLFSTILKINQRLREYLYINLFGALLIIILSYFTVKNGLSAVALSWLGGQIFMSLAFTAGYWRYSSRKKTLARI